MRSEVFETSRERAFLRCLLEISLRRYGCTRKGCASASEARRVGSGGSGSHRGRHDVSRSRTWNGVELLPWHGYRSASTESGRCFEYRRRRALNVGHSTVLGLVTAMSADTIVVFGGVRRSDSSVRPSPRRTERDRSFARNGNLAIRPP